MINELAPGWAEEKLGKLNKKLVDGSHNPPPRHQGGLPMLSAKNVSNGGIEFGGGRLIAPEPFENENRRTRVQAGDVLLTIVGSIGRSAIVPKKHQTFTLQRSVAVISPLGVSPHFLSYQFRSHRCQQYFVDFARGTAQKGIYLGALAEMPILVPPTKEQQRIVSTIDELFSGIEEGERALERVRKLVERCRQSVLKAAVTGELTREWREKHAGELESGEALLTRILEARRKAWEKSELDKMRAKGQRPLSNDWKKKYKEPAEIDTSELPELPAGWVWASLDMLSDLVGGITVDQKRETEGCERVPYLRVANVQRGYLDLSEMKMISAPANEIKQLTLEPGDILFNEGGDLDKLGRGWIWEGQYPNCIHQNHVFRARLFIRGNWSKIISWYGNVLGRKLFTALGKQTTNLASLSLSKLKPFAVPLMSAAEANEIVSRVENIDSLIGKEVDELSNGMASASSLRRAVLRTAFSGQLVPQDPADEPASVLLERIAAERSVLPRRAVTKLDRKKKVKA